jgi:hypothetical protein
MSLTKKQIEEYREKLRDSDYMEMAISDIADKFSAGHAEVATVKSPLCEPEINDMEEKEMQNKPIDLNNHLFEQLERLNDDELTEGEGLDREIRRADGKCKLAGQIIANRNSTVAALKALENIPGVTKKALLLE